MYSAFRIILVCFVLNSAVYVDTVRECQCYIIYIIIVLSNNFVLKICDHIVFSMLLTQINLKYFPDSVLWIMNLWRYLMNRKQYCCLRQCKGCTFEIILIAKESCTLSDIVYVNDVRRMQLSVCRTNSIMQWVLYTKNAFF